VWLQQHLQDLNGSTQSQMEEIIESAHREHQTKVQSQNTTTLQ